MSLTKLNYQTLIGKQIFADGWVRDNSGIILDGKIESIVEVAGYRNRSHYIFKTENSDKERKLEWIIVKALIEKGRWDANKFENSGTNARIIENPEKELYSLPDEPTKVEAPKEEAPKKEETKQNLNMSKQTENQHPFEVLMQVNVNDQVKILPNASKAKYLPWMNAWAEVKKRYPEATWKVKEHFTGNGEGLTLPYLATPLGIMVTTEVTINGQSQCMHLPVLNSSNKPLKAEPYKVVKYGKTQQVDAATMFDINTTIMRCLVKNIALFGLGLYIYTDDVLPENLEAPKAEEPKGRELVTTESPLYPQVIKFVKDNAKKKDIALILRQLSSKYKMDTNVLNNIQNIYDESTKAKG
jgi:hypothetical protein